MYRGHRIAVVMPIHNEEDHLARAIARVPAFVDLIVAVDDGSADRTWEQLSSIEDERLVRLRHEQNRGVGAATKTGYRYCLQAEVDLIAVMDGDGQMDGADLSRLLDRAIAGADYVKGNRFLHKGSISRMPLARYVGNVIFSWLTRRAARHAGSLDAQCGYTVIRRAALRRLDLDALYDRYGFLNEMLLAACRAGLAVACVPVRSVYGNETSGINPMTAVPVILCLIARGYLRQRFSAKPAVTILQIQESESGSVK
ncbi:MAG TPA: glycosyltransferase family 2 protein [Blastocatellia bacterium]|nr:glycosyltransferase family 2 protein [Blastocatellia bacterium]